MGKKIIECEYINISDIVIRNEKRSQEKYVMHIEKGGKFYYIYIKYNETEYPLHLAEYQRDFKNSTKSKTEDFINAVFSDKKMAPPININFREIDGCIYGCVVDGQQRITLIGRIKANIVKANRGSNSKFSSWSEEDKNIFDDFKMQASISFGKTYSEENIDYNYINSSSTPLTAAEKRKGKITEDLQDRLNKASNKFDSVYRRSTKNSDKYNHIYRSYITFFYIYRDQYNDIKVNTTDNKDLDKVQEYLKSLSDEEYKILSKSVRNKYSVIGDFISPLLEENDNCLVKNGKQRIANTHIVSLAFLQAIRDLEESYSVDIKNIIDEDITEEIGSDVRETISSFFNDDVISGKSTLHTLYEKAEVLYKDLIETLEPLFLYID